jgi:hypothetical protein
VNAQSIATNPFGSLGHLLGYNVQSIPMASSPFSYGMLNFTSHFQTPSQLLALMLVLKLGAQPLLILHFRLVFLKSLKRLLLLESFPLLTPGIILLLLSGETNLTDKLLLKFQSYTLTSLVLIPTNTCSMTNPPLSFRFTPGGGQFHTFGNPQPRATLAGGNFYNPHQNIPTGMMPNQPLMIHPGGGSYNIGQGHGAYHNFGWAIVPQTQSFQGAWG